MSSRDPAGETNCAFVTSGVWIDHRAAISQAAASEVSMIRRGTMATRLITRVLFGCALLAGSVPAGARPGATPSAPDADSSAAAQAQPGHEGIWKWVVPPVRMKGAFDDHDPIGLVAGKLIPADCSFNWTDPDTRQLYCFTSATSLVFFLDSPQTYLPQAERNWRALKGKSAKADQRAAAHGKPG